MSASTLLRAIRRLRSAVEPAERTPPTYVCASCGERFETVRRVCPDCEGLVVPRESTAAGEPYSM